MSTSISFVFNSYCIRDTCVTIRSYNTIQLTKVKIEMHRDIKFSQVAFVHDISLFFKFILEVLHVNRYDPSF